MANSYSKQIEGGESRRAYMAWAGFFLVGAAMLTTGVLLAAQMPDVAKPWTGLAFVVAAGLAAVVGASKTSSA